MKIKENLGLLLEGAHQKPNGIAKYCKNIALAYLKKKVSAGNNYILNLSNSLHDLAWDCIADLFERDDKGRFVQIETYFENESLDCLSEAEVQMKLRRLVFSKVNDGLFRNFGVFDMSLSKIIRNLKLAAAKHDLPINRWATDNYLLFGDQNTEDDSKPVFPPEFLEIKLTNRLNVTMDIPEIVDELDEIFTTQDHYQKRYPIVQLASVIRRSFVNLHDKHPTYRRPENPAISKEKLADFLKLSLEQCGECFRETYVEKGKIDAESLAKYITCIENILHHHYIDESEAGDSYYDHFNEVFPGVSKDQYRQQHRQYLEYMVKQVRRDLFLKLKKVI